MVATKSSHSIHIGGKIASVSGGADSRAPSECGRSQAEFRGNQPARRPAAIRREGGQSAATAKR